MPPEVGLRFHKELEGHPLDPTLALKPGCETQATADKYQAIHRQKWAKPTGVAPAASSSSSSPPPAGSDTGAASGLPQARNLPQLSKTGSRNWAWPELEDEGPIIDHVLQAHYTTPTHFVGVEWGAVAMGMLLELASYCLTAVSLKVLQQGLQASSKAGNSCREARCDFSALLALLNGVGACFMAIRVQHAAQNGDAPSCRSFAKDWSKHISSDSTLIFGVGKVKPERLVGFLEVAEAPPTVGNSQWCAVYDRKSNSSWATEVVGGALLKGVLTAAKVVRAKCTNASLNDRKWKMAIAVWSFNEVREKGYSFESILPYAIELKSFLTDNYDASAVVIAGSGHHWKVDHPEDFDREITSWRKWFRKNDILVVVG
jgi:hypothetical protein